MTPGGEDVAGKAAAADARAVGPIGLSHDVPLPGFQTGRRLVSLDLGLAAADWLQEANGAGLEIGKEIHLQPSGGGNFTFDFLAAGYLFRDQLISQGATPLELAPIDQALVELQEKASAGQVSSARDAKLAVMNTDQRAIALRAPARVALMSFPLIGGSWNVAPSQMNPTPAPPPNPSIGQQSARLQPASQGVVPTGLIPEFGDLFISLSRGKFLLPKRHWPLGFTFVPIDPAPAVAPSLIIIEEYAITSIPRDYGLGRTIRTFSLFPGEATQITVRNWRTTQSQRSNSSSILDSFSSEAADRFSSELHNQLSSSTSDESTDKSSWNASASAGIDLGFVSIGGGGGGSGQSEHHSAQSNFANSVGDTLVEHANRANDAREVTVSSTAERVDESGEESGSVRVIRNVNLRRTLNFVFSELNQLMETKVHLVDVKVGFANGRLNSWREAPLSGLRGLLSQLLVAGQVDPIAGRILALVGTAFDFDDQPVSVLETVELDAAAPKLSIKDAHRDQNGDYAPPTDTLTYRFKRGPLGKQDRPGLQGVLVDKRDVVLRTDGVMAEALLGEVDALDDYAMKKQREDIERRLLRNEREKVALDAIRAVPNGKERVAAFAKVFHDHRNEELVVEVEGDRVGRDA
jgi:hypothetical protein